MPSTTPSTKRSVTCSLSQSRSVSRTCTTMPILTMMSRLSAALFVRCAGLPTRNMLICAPWFIRWRAATKASPPLLPLPASTHIRLPETPPKYSSKAAATSRPAFSISRISGTPYSSMALLSIFFISSAKAIFMLLPLQNTLCNGIFPGMAQGKMYVPHAPFFRERRKEPGKMNLGCAERIGHDFNV